MFRNDRELRRATRLETLHRQKYGESKQDKIEDSAVEDRLNLQFEDAEDLEFEEKVKHKKKRKKSKYDE